MRAHLFQGASPADVRLLVEARLQLDEDRHLLAVLDGRVQGVGDRRGGAHAVERHLDGQHLGIDGGLPHEARHRVERLVRVVHEHVARADRAPHVGRVVEGRHRVRRLHVILEPRHVQRRVELQQVGERGEALVLVEVLRLQLQLLEQRGEDLRRQVGVVLQPHRGAEPAPAQALLDAGQQIDGPTSHLDVGVPRHADRVGR